MAIRTMRLTRKSPEPLRGEHSMEATTNPRPQPQSSTPRHDMYAGVHKGLRAFMGDTLAVVGRMDPADNHDVAAALDQARGLLAICLSHLEHENRFVHVAMEARQPGSTARTGEEHIGHEEAIDELTAEIGAVERATGPARTVAAHRLYLRLATFVADNLLHMHVEETANNAVLWACYADDELQAIEHALVASIPPAEMGAVLRWMIPAMSHPARVAMLSGMRQGAPADVFAGVLALTRAHVSARDWAKLADALGLAVEA
jgi:hypothetical protein